MEQDNRTIDGFIEDIREIVDIPTSGKKNVIMDSQVLTSVMNCPRLTDFRFNLNLQSLSGKSNSLECGSITHRFMESYYGAMIKGVNRDKAFGFAITDAELYIQGCPDCTGFEPTPELKKPACGHRVGDFPGVKNTPKDSADYKTGWQHVLETCDEYHRFYINDHWVPLEVETVKGEVLYEDDEIRVLWKAKLDLIADTNQGIFPIDHKTMKQRRNTLSLNNQFMGQCILMRTRNVFINKIGFQKTLKPVDKFLRPPISYSAARLLEWQGETLPFYAKQLLMYAEIGHYPPQFGQCEGKYGNCPFTGVCESDPGMREEEMKLHFIVGPHWNPVNENPEED
jgi:hypothetical protein